MSKHTQGPWQVSGLTHVESVDGDYICLDIGPRWPYVLNSDKVKAQTRSENVEEARANAALIAAAPTMYDVLQEAGQLIRDLVDSDYGCVTDQLVLEQIKEALNKAENRGSK